jgi:hypothetical protein
MAFRHSRRSSPPGAEPHRPAAMALDSGPDLAAVEMGALLFAVGTAG